MIVHMKQILIEIEPEIAEKLEQIAPGRSRRRSEFIRMAIRKALWDLEETATAQAYRNVPDGDADAYVDAEAWEGGKATKAKTGRSR
jgi:predicted transcriptional regulator